MNTCGIRRVALALAPALLMTSFVAVLAVGPSTEADAVVPVCRPLASAIKTSLGTIRGSHYALCERNNMAVVVTGRMTQGTRTNVTDPTNHKCASGFTRKQGGSWMCLHRDTTSLGDRSGTQQYVLKTKISWSGITKSSLTYVYY